MNLNIVFVGFISLCLRVVQANNYGLVNGQAAKLGDIPYIVSIRRMDVHICGGSIITDQHVLSAAQCAYIRVGNTTYQHSSFQFGVIKIYSQHDANYVPVLNIIVHPHFNQNTNKNDISVIKASNPFTFGPYVQKLALPPGTTLRLPLLNGTVSGFGYINNDTANDLLYYSISPIIDNGTACKELLEPTGGPDVYDTNSCYGKSFENKNLTGQCYGDLGGPFAVDIYGVNTLVGIQSWFEEPCGSNYGILTRVAPYLDWIFQYIRNDTNMMIPSY